MKTSFFAIAATAVAVSALAASSADAHTYTARHYRHALAGAYGYAAPSMTLRGAFGGAYGYVPPGVGYGRPLVTPYAAEHYTRRPPNADLNPDFQLGGNRS